MKNFYNQTLDKKGTKKIVAWFLSSFGPTKTSQFLEELKSVGFHQATLSGLSLGFDDLNIPTSKAALLDTAEKTVFESEKRFAQGKITAVERYQKLISLWTQASESLKDDVIEHFQRIDVFNPLYMMAFSGARGNISQVRQLVGMRGLMSDSAGGIIDFPIRRNFREGLTVTEYAISCYGARKGLIDTALRTADSGYLTRRLVDVAHGILIGRIECGTNEGFDMYPLTTTGKSGTESILVSVEKRILGRVLFTQENQVKNDTRDYSLIKRESPIEISPYVAEKLVRKAKEQKKYTICVRSPLTCLHSQDAREDICQLCYGWSLAHGRLVSLGDAVGILAAQSIGEPGTQLTMRTFHTGGIFSTELDAKIFAPQDGYVAYTVSELTPNQLRTFWPRGRKIRTFHGQTAFFLFEPLQLKIYSKPQLGRTDEDSNSSVFWLPKHSLLYVSAGQKILKQSLCAEITHVMGARRTKAQLGAPKYSKKPTAFENEASSAFDLRDIQAPLLGAGQKKKETSEAWFPDKKSTQLDAIDTEKSIDSNSPSKKVLSENEGQVYFHTSPTHSEEQNEGTSKLISMPVSLPNGSLWVLNGKAVSTSRLLAEGDFFKKGPNPKSSGKTHSTKGFTHAQSAGQKTTSPRRFDTGSDEGRHLQSVVSASIQRIHSTVGDGGSAAHRPRSQAGLASLDSGEVSSTLALKESSGNRFRKTSFFSKGCWSDTTALENQASPSHTISGLQSFSKALTPLDPVVYDVFTLSVQSASTALFFPSNLALPRRVSSAATPVLRKKNTKYSRKILATAKTRLAADEANKEVPSSHGSSYGSYDPQAARVSLYKQKAEALTKLFGELRHSSSGSADFSSWRSISTVFNDTSSRVGSDRALIPSSTPERFAFLAKQPRPSLLLSSDHLRDFHEVATQKQKIIGTCWFPSIYARKLNLDNASANPELSKDVSGLRNLVCVPYLESTGMAPPDTRKRDLKLLDIGVNTSVHVLSKFTSQRASFKLNSPQGSSMTAVASVGRLPSPIPKRVGTDKCDGIRLRKFHPYSLSYQSPLAVEHGDIVQPRQCLFELVYQQSKTGDIVQGLPKIEQLFEARRTSAHVIESIHTRLKQKFDESCLVLPLQEAAKQSIRFIQRILVDEIQLVYQSQGVDIGDKHVEIIVRQMTSKVIIHEKGQTSFFADDIVDFHRVPSAEERNPSDPYSKDNTQMKLGSTNQTLGMTRENSSLPKSISSPLSYEPFVLGVTKIAFLTESFVSAASFQEAKKVLMHCALESRVDFLYGLKENVILGRFIRAGTGFKSGKA